MKNIFLLTVPVILMLLPWLSASFAQNYIPGYLPEGAIARFGKGYPFDFEYSSDGTKLAVASTIGIWIYDTRAGGKELDLLTGHTYYVSRVIFGPDNKTLASICRWNDHTVRLWDGITGAPKATLIGHTGEIYTIVSVLTAKRWRVRVRTSVYGIVSPVNQKRRSQVIGVRLKC